jgi:hypothetical protein
MSSPVHQKSIYHGDDGEISDADDFGFHDDEIESLLLRASSMKTTYLPSIASNIDQPCEKPEILRSLDLQSVITSKPPTRSFVEQSSIIGAYEIVIQEMFSNPTSFTAVFDDFAPFYNAGMSSMASSDQHGSAHGHGSVVLMPRLEDALASHAQIKRRRLDGIHPVAHQVSCCIKQISFL